MAWLVVLLVVTVSGAFTLALPLGFVVWLVARRIRPGVPFPCVYLVVFFLLMLLYLLWRL